MSDKFVEYISMLKHFNNDLMNLNIKYCEEIERLKEENKILNIIINELKKGIENMWVDNSGEDTWQYKEESWLCRKEFLDKIKELKGSDEE